jgi:hypothetical protein
MDGCAGRSGVLEEVIMTEGWESEVNLLPDPRPSLIELSDDAFIRNPHLKDGEADRAGIEKLLAMTPTERLRWNEYWRQFVRPCERRAYTPAMIAALVWGDAQANEPS